jgi:hypothetical protein
MQGIWLFGWAILLALYVRETSFPDIESARLTRSLADIYGHQGGHGTTSRVAHSNASQIHIVFFAVFACITSSTSLPSLDRAGRSDQPRAVLFCVCAPSLVVARPD